MALAYKGAKVELHPVDRSNFRAMLELRLRPQQERFVAPPAKSLAASYVREYGDNYRYAPMVICADSKVVGYVTTMCDPTSDDDYWIDDIMIDVLEQGRGYGRAAVVEAVSAMVAAHPRCRAVRLTCFRGNEVAARVYRGIGFRENGRLNPVNREPEWELSGPALDRYRA
jgi:RimJ/RimL family protein N-acetyltransferase